MLRTPILDKTISQNIQQRLGRSGLDSQAKVTATVRNGNVTLTGTLHHEMQRRTAVRAAQGVEGVRNVSDQLTIKAQPHKWAVTPDRQPGDPRP